MSSDILLNLLLNPFFHVRAEDEVPVHAISLGLCENVEVSLAKQCSDLLSKTQPLYMHPLQIQLWGLQSQTSPPLRKGIVVLFQVLTTISGSEI